MYTKYNQLLIKHPLITNMSSTGILFGTGDYLAQSFFLDGKAENYDFARTCRAILYGGLCFAPMADKWYKTLNKLKLPFRTIKLSHRKAMAINTIIKVGMDQFIFTPFIAIPMYYGVMTILNQSTNPWPEIKHKIYTNFWPTLTTNWMIWPLVQLLNFSIIPVRFNLLLVNIVSIVWNCYLSFVFNKS